MRHANDGRGPVSEQINQDAVAGLLDGVRALRERVGLVKRPGVLAQIYAAVALLGHPLGDLAVHGHQISFPGGDPLW